MSKKWWIFGLLMFIIGLLHTVSPFICNMGGNSKCMALLSIPTLVFNYIGLKWVNIGHPPSSLIMTPIFYVVIWFLIYFARKLLKKINLKKRLIFVLLTFLFVAVLPIVLGYNVDPPENVHQHITNESAKVWTLIPPEMKQHLKTPLNQNLDSDNFQNGEDIITGSGEEDRPEANAVLHFFQPDNPYGGIGQYNDGIFVFESSYTRALNIWTQNVIPSYLKGNVEESYYYLGRVVHLLEDASQPSHVHLDPHNPSFGGTSIIETWTGTNFNQYNGTNYAEKQYNYEDLIDGFNWINVDPTGSSSKLNIGLFRLFWYTAQKSQYWASDDRPANYTYVELDGDVAITTGILNVLPTAIIHNEQQVYTRNASNTQQLGRFDKFVQYNNQRWAFNYVTSGESFTNMQNISNIFFVLEMQGLTPVQIETLVAQFINQTKN